MGHRPSVPAFGCQSGSCHYIVRRVGVTRQEASTFFFAEVADYLYAGDTALHMAAAAFRRRVANSWFGTEPIAERKSTEGRSRFTTRRTPTDGIRRRRLR